jgi:hypothetical protein
MTVVANLWILAKGLMMPWIMAISLISFHPVPTAASGKGLLIFGGFLLAGGGASGRGDRVRVAGPRGWNILSVLTGALKMQDLRQCASWPQSFYYFFFFQSLIH